MALMHPRMSQQLVAPGRGGAAVADRGSEVALEPPGLLGRYWGTMTPVGMLMGHVLFGAVLALVYQALE